MPRSLVLFHQESGQEKCNQLEIDIVKSSTAFKYKKFDSYEKALQWFQEKKSEFTASDSNLIRFAKQGSDPFQFMARVLSYDRAEECKKLPITQDAASSAYQIISYFLLNEDMARKTNLMEDPDGQIQDVYLHLLEEFANYIKEILTKKGEKEKLGIILHQLDRKLIKSIFMPLIYGKGVISLEHDIREKYGNWLSRKDTFDFAVLAKEFWSVKYPDIINFMNLLSIISWFSSMKEKAVVYNIPFFSTMQDYMSWEKDVIVVYERQKKKRRRITLKVPSLKRDSRKSQTSACANFIHQKDAYIAMKVIEALLIKEAPIYTVHDNFLSTASHAQILPQVYTDVFIQMGDPLYIINDFILSNLIETNNRLQL